MKNIHILPTDEPSRLVKQKYDIIDRLCLADMATKRAEYKRFNIYITSDEEIKKDEYYLGEDNNIYCLVTTVNFNGKKIILTTDQDLIKDGVQAIPDDFLEWFVKNPSCEEVEVQKWFDGVYFTEYKITIPKEEYKYPIDGYAPGYYMCTCSTCKKQFQGDKRAVQCEPCAIEMIKKEPKSLMEKLKPLQEQWQRDMLKSLQEPKQETLEEAAEKFVNNTRLKNPKSIFCEGAKWQQERSYSEEEVYSITQQLRLQLKNGVLKWQDDFEFDLEKWFEQYKKQIK